jgi:succinoglycan biosynthesis transport protein ExoP
MGYLVADRLPPTYESEAQLVVGPVSGDRDTLEAAGQQARNYAGLATAKIIIEPAARDLQMSAQTLKSKIEDVTASEVTRLLSVRVHDGNRIRAAAIANAVAEQLVAYSTEGGVVPTPPAGRLQIIDRATPPTEGIGPSSELIIVLAGLAGLLAAFGLAVVVDGLSTVVRNEQELASLAPVAFLGSINGARPRSPSQPFVVEADPDSRAAAAYRLLATKIELSNGDQPPDSVLVLDAHGGRSGSRLALNLAGALAEGGTRVALIHHGDEGELEKLFGLPPDEATESAFRRGRPLRVDRMMFDRFRIRRPPVTVFRPRASSDLLEPEQVVEVLRRVLADADVAVLTAPPVDSSPHGLVWSAAARATVLVAERDHTQRAHVPAALESLRLAGGNVIGIVLSGDHSL